MHGFLIPSYSLLNAHDVIIIIPNKSTHIRTNSCWGSLQYPCSYQPSLLLIIIISTNSGIFFTVRPKIDSIPTTILLPVPWVSRYWRPRALSALASPWTSVVGSCSSHNENCCLKNMGTVKSNTTLYHFIFYDFMFGLDLSFKFQFQWISIKVYLQGIYIYILYSFQTHPFLLVKHQLKASTPIFEPSQNEHRSGPGRSRRPRNPMQQLSVGWNMKTNWIQVLGNRNQNTKKKNADSRMAIMTVKTE